MGGFPIAPTFPVDVSADPGSGILVSRQGSALKLALDPNAGPSGAAVTDVAASAVGLHRALRSGAAGVGPYSASDATQFGAYVGLSLGIGLVGQPVTYTASGPIDDTGWNWTPGQPVYAADSGTLTQTEPSVGVCQIVGVAVSATRLLAQRLPPILL